MNYFNFPIYVEYCFMSKYVICFRESPKHSQTECESGSVWEWCSVNDSEVHVIYNALNPSLPLFCVYFVMWKSVRSKVYFQIHTGLPLCREATSHKWARMFSLQGKPCILASRCLGFRQAWKREISLNPALVIPSFYRWSSLWHPLVACLYCRDSDMVTSH